MAGRHETWAECVDSLRSRIADLEFRAERRTSKPADTTPSHRGGHRDRKDARMVILDGERITLTEAGRRLGITGAALHFRILHRTGTAEYGEVDLRAIGADVRRQMVHSDAIGSDEQRGGLQDGRSEQFL